MSVCSNVTPFLLIESGAKGLVVRMDAGRVDALGEVGVVAKGFVVRMACLRCCWSSACLLAKWMLIFSVIDACSCNCFARMSSIVLSKLSMDSWWWNLWFTDLVPGKLFAWPWG